MDALNAIAIAMTAMVFIWVGYFLGIFFPTFGKSKRLKDERKAAGESLIDLKAIGKGLSGAKDKVDLSFIRKAGKKAADWLLEREETEIEEEDAAAQEEGEDLQTSFPTETTTEPVAVQPEDAQAVYLPPDLNIPDEAVVLWHDRQNKKLFAKMGKSVVDLDDELSKDQHGTLSMLLVDLQDRVGLSATLKAALSEGTEKVFAEKEKQRKAPTPPAEEPLQKPSLNPVTNFLNFVKADVPKLGDKPDSIPAQINSILQEMLVDSPFVEKGVSVTEWPQRGVVFIVGIEVYDSIDEIPDAGIREMIQQAVKRWEDSQTEEKNSGGVN